MGESIDAHAACVQSCQLHKLTGGPILPGSAPGLKSVASAEGIGCTLDGQVRGQYAGILYPEQEPCLNELRQERRRVGENIWPQATVHDRQRGLNATQLDIGHLHMGTAKVINAMLAAS